MKKDNYFDETRVYDMNQAFNAYKIIAFKLTEKLNIYP